jgi:phosphoglycerate dehydrogenase-like enzyme
MRRLIIASTLSDVQNGLLTAHPLAPHVIAHAGAPWLPPAEAEALFTYQSQWKVAPAGPPAGWPFALRWLQVASAGVDTFPDWIHAVPLVTRARGVQSALIAEFVIGAIFAHEKQFWSLRVRAPGDWQPRNLGTVAGRRLGIFGFGSIGETVARLAAPLGLQLMACVRRDRPALPGVALTRAPRDLVAWSDHLVLCLPLAPDTRGIVDAALLAAAQPGLHLINVARGALIDDRALLAALEAGQIGAATLDVTQPEPPPPGHPFYTHRQIRLLPHVAAMAEGSDARLARLLAANLAAYLETGQPEGRVLPAQPSAGPA